MMDFKLSSTFDLMIKTLPFLVFRFIVYVGIVFVYIIGMTIGAGTGYMLDRIAGTTGGFTFGGALVGFGIVGVVAYLLREYILYMVKAGHIAVLTELMDGGKIPGGKGQIDHAQAVVRERFVESSVLFGVDQLIKAILRAFNRIFFRIARFLPAAGGLGALVKFINTVINMSLTFLDEVILAYNIRTRSDNPWKSSRTAIVLYAQNYKAFLKNAFFLAVFIWVLTFVVFIVALMPAAALVTILPQTAGIFTVIIALLFAWGVKQALIEPFGMISLMQVFFKVTEGQEPNPEWENKLEGVSKKFGELGRKAGEWNPMDKPAPAPTTEPASEPPQAT